MYGNTPQTHQQPPHQQHFGHGPPPTPRVSQAPAQGNPQQLARLARERGEAVGMLEIIQRKLAAVEEENFDLRANMLAAEAEIKFESRRKEEAMGRQVASLESKLSFLQEQLRNAERGKLRALRELEELQQRQVLEQKRLDAEKRLLATKKRKHESVLLAASQSLHARLSQLEPSASQPSLSQSQASHHRGAGGVQAAIPVIPSGSAVEQGAQTDPPTEMEQRITDNCRLLAELMDMASRDLLVLFKGPMSADRDESTADEDEPMADDESLVREAPPAATALASATICDVRPSQLATGGGDASAAMGLSQSVFSQIAGHAQAQAQASLRNFAQEANLTQAAYASERARDLHDALASMIRGEVASPALAPVITAYLAAPTDLDAQVLRAVLRVLYFVIAHSEAFQEFLLPSTTTASSSSSTASQPGSSTVPSPMQHPRITLPGLRYASLADYLAAKKEAAMPRTSMAATTVTQEDLAERMQLRTKLMSALCRVIKNNMNESVVVESGLSVLRLWVDLGQDDHRRAHADYSALISSNVIQDVILAPPRSVAPGLKTSALGILAQLLQRPEAFADLAAASRRSLLFNRCARMLSVTSTSQAPENRRLQRMIIRVFMTIVVSYPSTGVRFVLESTRGQPRDKDRDGERSVVFHLAQLLDHETFDARTLGRDAVDELLAEAPRVGLIQDAFGLVGQLVRYVDLGLELDGMAREYAFLSVLYLLSSGRFDHPASDLLSRTARALVALITSTSAL